MIRIETSEDYLAWVRYQMANERAERAYDRAMNPDPEKDADE